MHSDLSSPPSTSTLSEPPTSPRVPIEHPQIQRKREHKHITYTEEQKEHRRQQRRQKGSHDQDLQNARRKQKRDLRTQYMRNNVLELSLGMYDSLIDNTAISKQLKFGWERIKTLDIQFKFRFPSDYIPQELFRGSSRSHTTPLARLDIPKPAEWPANDMVAASVAMSRHLQLYRLITGRELLSTEGKYLGCCSCKALCLFEPNTCHECLLSKGLLVWKSHASDTVGRTCGVFAARNYEAMEPVGVFNGEILVKENGGAYNLAWDGRDGIRRVWSAQQTRCVVKFVNTATNAQDQLCNSTWDDAPNTNAPMLRINEGTRVKRGEEILAFYAEEDEEQLVETNPLPRRGGGKRLKWEQA